MSRTSSCTCILTLATAATLGTTSLVPAYAGHHGGSRSAPAASRPVGARAAPVAHSASIAYSAPAVRPAAMTRPMPGPSATAHVAAPISNSNAATNTAHQPPGVAPGFATNSKQQGLAPSTSRNLQNMAAATHNSPTLPSNLTNGPTGVGRSLATSNNIASQTTSAPTLQTSLMALTNHQHGGNIASSGTIAAPTSGPSAKNNWTSPNTSANTVTTPANQGRAGKTEAKKDIKQANNDTKTAEQDVGKADLLRDEAAKARAQAAKATDPLKAFQDRLRAQADEAQARKLDKDAAHLIKEADTLKKDAKALKPQPGDKTQPADAGGNTPGQQPSVQQAGGGQQPTVVQPSADPSASQAPAAQPSTASVAPASQQAAAVDNSQAQPASAAATSPAVQPSAPAAIANQPASGTTAPSALFAMALSWNPTGGWWVSRGSSVDIAGNKAVAQCNSRFGNCSLSAATVAPEASGCIAVARVSNDRSKLFAGIGETRDAARASALQQFGNETGEFKFAACNSRR